MAKSSPILLLVITHAIALVNAEIFTALTTLTKALQYEKSLAGNLREYVKLEQERLQKVLELADSYERHAETALVDAESYVANPVNAYLFVKTFTTDLPKTKELVSGKQNSEEFLQLLEDYQPYLPDEEDFEGVVAAILRLQDTYQLTSQQIADGTFTPTNRSPPMSALDCFNFGAFAHKYQDHYHALIWMDEAYQRLQQESNHTVSPSSVLDYLAFACYNQGNVHHAKHWTLEWLKLEPNHDRALSNILYFNKEIEQEQAKLESEGQSAPHPDVLPSLKNPRVTDEYRSGKEFQVYEALCRGEDVLPNPHVHKLSCYYTTSGDNPLLVLAPVKVEEYYLDPYIVLYHDVISDKEIKIIKEISTPMLKRATVNDPATGKLVTAHYRVSRSAWLKDEMNDTIQTLSNRISAITHLNMEQAEDLQIQNYGIGGQYEPHCDHARRHKEMSAFPPEEGNRIATWIYYSVDARQFEESRGNRIATFIFYFDEVDAGGLTVFTQLGAKIPPKKGSAAFWFNLKPDGQGNDLMRHAGCPVLSGSKWVANKWFHERGQEFMQPCGLAPNK